MKGSIFAFLFAVFLRNAEAFTVIPHSRAVPSVYHQPRKPTKLAMADPLAIIEAFTSLQLAETEPWVQPSAIFLDIFLNFLSLAMLSRVVLSWYPTTNVKEFPWVAIVVPTEPLLKAVRGFVPPAFGVDITPVFWLAIFTFIHEILVGQQGLLTMKIKYGI